MEPGTPEFLERLRVERMIAAGRPPTVIAHQVAKMKISEEAKVSLGKLIIDSHPDCVNSLPYRERA